MPSVENKIAIITPIDFSRRSSQLKRRLRLIADSLKGSEFFLVVAYSYDIDSEIWLEDGVKTWGKDFLKIVPVTRKSPLAELSRLRNEAVKAINAKYLMLLDVDIFPDLEVFRGIYADAINGDGFSMAPCIYLSPKGTREVFNNRIELIKRYLNFSVNEVMHMAMPSSVVVLRRKDYLAIGGFCEEYVGHGYEDFDFLIRLSLYKKRPINKKQILVDKVYRAPLLSEGFRSELAKFCVKNLLDGNIVFHLFHKKRNNEKYYKERYLNKERFNFLLSSLVSDSLSNNEVTLVEFFIKACKDRNLNYLDFSALFDARPRYMLVKKNIIYRLFIYFFKRNEF